MQLKSIHDLCPDPSVLGISENISGWNSEKPEFAQIVQEAAPKLIVEVGCWVGQGTLRLAELAPEAIIIAVDTWLGSTDHNGNIPMENGYPLLYKTFLRNIAGKPAASRIFPMPQTSKTAARFIKTLPQKPDTIYIDGSHEVGDVYDDVSAYYEVLAQGGTLFGDDYGDRHHPGVKVSVQRFALERGFVVTGANGFWRIKKT